MTPRPYQTAAIEAFATLVAGSADPGRPCGAVVSLPTGTGKTIVGMLSVKAMGRTLFVAPRKNLVAQTLRAWSEKMGEPGGGESLQSPRLVVRTYQYLCRAKSLELLSAEHARDPFALVIVDECHHASSASTMRILGSLPGVPRLGLTATPSRADGQGLVGPGGPFPSGEVYRLRVDKAIADGWLVPYEARRIRLKDLDRDLGRTRSGEVDEKLVGAALMEERALAAVTAGLLEGFKGCRRTIAFAISVAHAKEIARRLTDAGMSAAAVHGGMKDSEIAQLLGMHQAEEFRCLVNCQLLTEGYDDPPIDGVAPALTRSMERYMQMAGRGLRLSPDTGKTSCRIVDLVGVHAAHGLAGIGELAKYDDALEKRAAVARAAADAKLANEAAEARVAAMLRAMIGGIEPVVTPFGRAAWLEVGKDGHALPIEGGAILIRQVSSGFEAWRCLSRARPIYVGERSEVETLKRLIENRVVKRSDLRFADPMAPWRKRPASPKAKQALRRWGLPCPKGIKGGEASDLMDKKKAQAGLRAIRHMRESGVCAYSWGAF